MIPIRLFLSDMWFGILNFKNAKHLKKELNEELMRCILIDGGIGACQKMRKKK